MRELQMKTFCDVCRLDSDDDDIREPATACYTVGVMQGEGRPVPKVLDLCEDHVGPLEDLLELLSGIDQLPGGDVVRKTGAKVALKAPPAPQNRNESPCAICHGQFSTAGLTQHIWKAHRPDPKPPMPARCPECGSRHGGPGMAAHRRIVHGYSSIDDALSGVPGYRPGKSAGELTANQQLELTAS